DDQARDRLPRGTAPDRPAEPRHHRRRRSRGQAGRPGGGALRRRRVRHRRGVRRVVEPRRVHRVPATGAHPGLAGRHPRHARRRPSPADDPPGDGVRPRRRWAPAVGQDAGVRHRPARREV
ncbi:MAG: Peptidylprolyl isomerase, FKBP-type, partial [uncultured Nocardioidaceae bacterium]